MSEKIKALEDFLYENNIKCDTCEFYNNKNQRPDRMYGVCFCDNNYQSNVHSGQLFYPKNKNMMCSNWKHKQAED